MDVNKDERLVYVGKIISIDAIPNADFIVSATVVCGTGGKWRGIVKKDHFEVGDKCIVYLPDSIIPEHESMDFMVATNWRVRMRRFKGAPSEVVIINIITESGRKYWEIGTDITQACGVTKYIKKIPACMSGEAKGDFPTFIPKTDEPNYQRCNDDINKLIGQPYYITEKCDGTSTTAYRHNGIFGVCSRNLELLMNENNIYWKMFIKYNLENTLPTGYAIQFETCGPGIQSNPMGLKEICAFAFNIYNILEQRYLNYKEFIDMCDEMGFPTVKICASGDEFYPGGLELLGEGTYDNGKQREGVVVRSQHNFGHKPISFKVINLGYDK